MQEEKVKKYSSSESIRRPGRDSGAAGGESEENSSQVVNNCKKWKDRLACSSLLLNFDTFCSTYRRPATHDSNFLHRASVHVRLCQAGAATIVVSRPLHPRNKHTATHKYATIYLALVTDQIWTTQLIVLAGTVEFHNYQRQSIHFQNKPLLTLGFLSSSTASGADQRIQDLQCPWRSRKHTRASCASTVIFVSPVR